MTKKDLLRMDLESLGKHVSQIPSVMTKDDNQLLLWLFEELGEIARANSRIERENADSLLAEIADFVTLFSAFLHRKGYTLIDVISEYIAKAESKGRLNLSKGGKE